MAHRKEGGRHFDKYRWHSNDRKIAWQTSRQNAPNTPSSLHSHHSTYYQDNYSNDYHHSSMSRYQTQVWYDPHQASNQDCDPRQARKRSLHSIRFHDNTVDFSPPNKRMCTELSSVITSQVDRKMNKKTSDEEYSQYEVQAKRVAMAISSKQSSNNLSGYHGSAGNKRGSDYLQEDSNNHVQLKKFKNDYQEASTSHQRYSSLLSRSRFKQTTFVETLPYPAEGVEVLYTKNANDAEMWLKSNVINTSAKEIGLDIEWRPQFIPKKKGGKENKTAVIQLSVENSCLVFHIFYFKKYPKSLLEVLSNKEVLKVGSGINGDAVKLLNDTGLLCDGRVDTQDYARCLCIQQGVGLKNLAKQVLNIEMDKPKSVSLSNWEYFPLRKNQIHYAALDAWISLKLYLKLKEQLDLENKTKANPKSVEVHYGLPSQGKKKNISKKKINKDLCGKPEERQRETPQPKEMSHVGTSASTSGADTCQLIKCPIVECHGKYESEEELQEHIKARHVACKVCGKLYRTKVSVKHKKQHAKEQADRVLTSSK